MKVPTIAAIFGLSTLVCAEVSSGKWSADAEKNAGLRTTEDYRFYATSTKFDKPFDSKDKDFVVQFDVKNEQNIDCGGSYVKGAYQMNIFSDKFKTFSGDSEYNIMFGPDICVLVDGVEKATGKLEEDWDFLPPKIIKDPGALKSADWVDDAEIDDPSDAKPADWDDIPEFVADPEAVKPEDWDDDMDGEWDAPSISNPDYKGQWSPKRIPNPDYKGEWRHPEIDNPEYKLDNSIYHYNFENIGFDLWQVKSGTIFDNLLVTDGVEEAKKFRDESLALALEEVKAKEAHEEQEKANLEAQTPAEEKYTDGDEPADIDLGELSVESDIKEETQEEIKEAAKEEVKETKPVKDEL